MDALRACGQVMQTLYAFENNASTVTPLLAESCTPNGNLTAWTCTLRQNVKFQDGTLLDANDVVATFTMGLDVNSPTHKGNSNTWAYYQGILGLVGQTYNPNLHVFVTQDRIEARDWPDGHTVMWSP
jgi:peptide/nickel transport system substrate-binding protein